MKECVDTQKVPEVKLTLNVMDSDQSLYGKIKGILMQAELEILDEFRLHYGELVPKISENINGIKEKLSPLQEDNTVKETFEQCQIENTKLEQKLKTRRDKKKKNIPTLTDRIKAIDQGEVEEKRRQHRPPNHGANSSNQYRDDKFSNPPRRGRNQPQDQQRNQQYQSGYRMREDSYYNRRVPQQPLTT